MAKATKVKAATRFSAMNDIMPNSAGSAELLPISPTWPNTEYPTADHDMTDSDMSDDDTAGTGASKAGTTGTGLPPIDPRPPQQREGRYLTPPIPPRNPKRLSPPAIPPRNPNRPSPAQKAHHATPLQGREYAGPVSVLGQDASTVGRGVPHTHVWLQMGLGSEALRDLVAELDGENRGVEGRLAPTVMVCDGCREVVQDGVWKCQLKACAGFFCDACFFSSRAGRPEWIESDGEEGEE
ncbi:MAG: hypothetical protein M1839_008849 [Geoglossum umbratile]|nr:MAG: hypothetical protein M1839_008849 [Geoglossum umbratile]